MRKIFLLLNLFVSSMCPAQPGEEWVARYNGPASGDDFGRAMQIDEHGNSYIAGSSAGNGSAKDFAVAKYNSAGEEKWIARYNGTANGDDWAYALCVDASGNVYVTGESAGINSAKDFATVKYDSSGNEKWVMRYNGAANSDDVAQHIGADNEGNVYVTGISQGVGTISDFATIKYDSSGNEKWVIRYNGNSNSVDEARTITVDYNHGVLYVGGGSMDSVSGNDYCIVKYDTAGNEKWIYKYNGPGNDYDMIYYQGSLALDSLGNIYATGYSTGIDSSYDYATIKLDSSGTEIWARRFSHQTGGYDYADHLVIDDSLNVYVTGASYDSLNNFDFATVKYNHDGDEQWTSFYNGTANGWDEAYSVASDDSMNVYVVGRSVGAGTNADFVTLKYDRNGNEKWNLHHGTGSGYDWPFSIRVDSAKNIFVGGQVDAFSGSPTASDFMIIKYSASATGIQEISSSQNNVTISPNPSNGNFMIKTDQPLVMNSIEIFNVLGEKVYAQKDLQGFENLVSLPANISSGIYFVKLIDGENIFSQKLVIQNQ